jgi:deoxyadenosine/deoxycytidine kinase
MNNPLKYIAVDGPIGAGKTTLVKMLAEDLKGKTVLEPAEKNPFLPEFYKDRKKNAFKTQLFFLLNRYQQQLELKQHDLFTSSIFCDYTFAKDAIFAQINLSEDEQNLYQKIYNLLRANLSKPDLVIYLRADSKILLQRIKKRGVEYERSISQDYLDKLNEAYNKFFLNYHETPLLVADTTSTDYLEKPEDYSNLKREILNHRGGTVHLISR